MPTPEPRDARKSDPSGVLVVDKPTGPTSHDVVARVRSALRVKRAGHTGTLDPLASGVLVVCVGEATKLAGYLTYAEKTYDCTARLGIATDTHDATGQVLEERPVEVTREEVEAVLGRFRGQIAQIPPMFSALKKGGRRLYKLARKGETVEREPRTVMVHRLELTRFEPPEMDLLVTCGKGTYVRTLLHDIGEVLGCGATLSRLVRTRVGSVSLDDAVSLDDLTDARSPEAREALRAGLMPMSEAMAEYPSVRLDKRKVRAIGHGKALGPGEVAQAGGGGLRAGQLVRLLDEAGQLVALGEMKTHGLQPVRVFQLG
jgi:tRNA pseudouridine55 synthase